MALPLAGQAALVTGGGSGIGLACARWLVRDGCAVTLMGRTEAKVKEAAEALGADAPDGAAVTWSAGSVADEPDVEAAVATATEATGGLDVAVLAAGTGNAGPLLLMEKTAWQAVLDTNLTGAFLSLKHAGRAMARSGGGSIVAISSIAAVRTHRFMGPYCVSKGGLDTLVQNAADELGVAGIRVNSVRPGLVPTELSAALEHDEQVRGDYLDQMPVRRLGTVDDVAALVRHLAGPEAGWITGQTISVDGGHHLRRGPNIEPWMRGLFGDDAAEGRV
jgi:NAD(P)-dependent dehydrogenase (short-subunit alcohol dehydrogenase family)